MDLCDVSGACFSKWVQVSSDRKLSRDDSRISKKVRKTSRQSSRSSTTDTVYYDKAKYSEEEFKETLQKWIQNPEHGETVKLKKLVRQGVSPKLRSELWTDASGGADIIFNSPQYYEETVDHMGKKGSALHFIRMCQVVQKKD